MDELPATHSSPSEIERKKKSESIASGFPSLHLVHICLIIWLTMVTDLMTSCPIPRNPPNIPLVMFPFFPTVSLMNCIACVSCPVRHSNPDRWSSFPSCLHARLTVYSYKRLGDTDIKYEPCFDGCPGITHQWSSSSIFSLSFLKPNRANRIQSLMKWRNEY